MIRTDLGIATAYAEAVSKGYTGTRDEFGQMFADFGKTAEKVTEDKKAVEQMKLSVEETKNSVDTTASEFGQNVADMTAEATAAITEHANTEKESATAAISEAKNVATGAITEAQTSATDAIASAKDSATAEITKKGTDTLATIPEDYTALTGQVGSLKEDLVDETNRAKTEEKRIEELFILPTEEAVNKWLDEHPEATTTVQDGAITEKKLNEELGQTLQRVRRDLINVKNFGAVGDGVTDDSDAFISAINYANENTLGLYVPYGEYIITKDLPSVFVGFSCIGEGRSLYNDENSRSNIIDKRISSEYLFKYDRTLTRKNGGSFCEIAFTSYNDMDTDRNCLHIFRGWDGLIQNCVFFGYENAIYASGDDWRIINCLFVFCGSKSKKEQPIYAVHLSDCNEKRFIACHFEHFRYAVRISGSSYHNSFVSCKFEMGTLYPVLSEKSSPILIDSVYAYYSNRFIGCEFHSPDIEWYIEMCGMSSYDDVPYMINNNGRSILQLSSCELTAGPGSGNTIYKQFCQAKYVEGNNAIVDGCNIIHPSYLVSAIDVKNLILTSNKFNINTDGEYSLSTIIKPIVNYDNWQYTLSQNNNVVMYYKDIAGDDFIPLFGFAYDYLLKSSRFTKGLPNAINGYETIVIQLSDSEQVCDIFTVSYYRQGIGDNVGEFSFSVRGYSTTVPITQIDNTKFIYRVDGFNIYISYKDNKIYIQIPSSTSRQNRVKIKNMNENNPIYWYTDKSIKDLLTEYTQQQAVFS